MNYKQDKEVIRELWELFPEISWDFTSKNAGISVDDFILSQRKQDREAIREWARKKRHYALEEYDHESKLMSVGFNQCIDHLLSFFDSLEK